MYILLTLQAGTPVTDASYFASLTLPQLSDILRSDSSVEMPMMEERLKNLREAGKVLIEVSGSPSTEFSPELFFKHQVFVAQVIDNAVVPVT